jgi:hypothetical protein
MKFAITQITAAILSASAASAAYLEPRQDAYPQGTNTNVLNGTCKYIMHEKEKHDN